jgi:hypothetical protein
MIEIIGLGCLGYLLTVAEPMIFLKRFLGFKEEYYDEYSRIKQFFFRLLSCPMCFTFWFSLITSQSLYIGAIAAIIAMIIEKNN